MPSLVEKGVSHRFRLWVEGCGPPGVTDILATLPPAWVVTKADSVSDFVDVTSLGSVTTQSLLTSTSVIISGYISDWWKNG